MTKLFIFLFPKILKSVKTVLPRTLSETQNDMVPINNPIMHLSLSELPRNSRKLSKTFTVKNTKYTGNKITNSIFYSFILSDIVVDRFMQLNDKNKQEPRYTRARYFSKLIDC